ncbi:MAG: ABC transporter permease [Pirellulales bacterium]
MRSIASRREISVLLALLGIFAILAWRAPHFFSGGNLKDILVTAAPVLICSVGMTLVVLSRQIDISIGSQFSLDCIVAALLAQAGVPMPLVVVMTLLFGAGLGAVNGVLVGWWQLPSIVTTLATMVLWRESLRWWREGAFVRDLPISYQWFGLSQGAGQAVIIGTAIGVLWVAAWGLRNLAAGRYVFAVGAAPESARLMGIRPSRVIFATFVAMGMLTALAAVLNGIRFAHADPNFGSGLELKVIAAVVVGGTLVTGGRGSLLGTALGVLLLGVIGPALVFLDVAPQWEKALQGLIILAAVAGDAIWSASRRRGN